MTKIKLLSVVILSSLMALFLNSCDETTSTTDSNPVITSVSPMVAQIGDTVTIKGTNFGAEDEAGTVYFNNTPVPSTGYPMWTNTEIHVIVPTGATSGKVVVENQGNKSTGVDFYIGNMTPAPVTNLRANSKDSASIAIKWDPSADASMAYFKGYKITIGSQSDYVPSTAISYSISNLTEGEIYSVSVYSVYTDTTKMSAAATIQWSPASRFVKRSADDEPFVLYESSATTGSGIDLFDEDKGEPFTVTVGQSSQWNVGLSTKSNTFVFGSASKLDYTFTGGEPADAEIAEPVEVDALDKVWDTEALDKKTFKTQVFDLKDSKYAGKNLVFVVRTMVGTNNYQYAKVFLKATLMGDSPNRYVQCEISYQKKAGVPYAIHQ